MTKGRPWTKAEVRSYADDLTAVTIPVNVRIEGRQKVLSFPQVEKILRNAEVITLADCLCRVRVKGCDRPIDVCLYLDAEGREMIENRSAKRVTLKQALDVLRRTNEAGLVHMSFTNKGEKDPIYICGCCACCCHSFAAIQRFGFSDAIISAEMIAAQDDELCDDCGVCVERCQFRARMMDGDRLVFERGRCSGCGLCVTSCPSDAISLVRR